MTVEFWRHGGWPVPLARSGEYAARLEALGWDGLAVGENGAVLADPYICLALAAASTSKIKLGTGVLVPIRHPLQAASAIASIHAVSGGRTHFSIGRGDSAMHVLGRKPLRVAEFRTYIERLQAYVSNHDVILDGVASNLTQLFASDPAYDIAKPPVNVSATGPKMIQMAAELADGVTFAVGGDTKRLARCIEHVRTARAEAGLPMEGFSLGAYVPTAVTSKDRSDIAEAREAIRGAAMVHARFSAFNGSALPDLPEDEREALSRISNQMKASLAASKVGTQVWGHMGDSKMYPDQALEDEFIDRFSVVGPAEYVAERLRELIDVGIDRILVLTRGLGVDPKDQNQERIARDVLPLLRT